MLKVLINKQLSELASVMFRGKKNTGKNSVGLKILYVVLYIVMLVGMYFLMTIFATIFKGGDASAYFSMTAVAAVALGILGSIFTVQSMLYDAKDNETLSAMPIPHSYIIISRMVPLYLMCLVIESMIIIPAYLAFPMTVMRCVMLPVSLIFLPLGSLAVCAAVGLPFSVLCAKSRFKNLFLTMLSLLLLIGTLYLRVQSNQIFTSILENGEAVAEAISEYLSPIGFIGEGMSESIGYGALTALICTALFSMALIVLSKSFIRVAGVRAGVRARRFKSGRMKSRSIVSALFGKELGRFTASYIYMINSAIGTIIMLIASVMAAANKNALAEAFYALSIGDGMYTLLIVGMVCLTASMNTITAPSISLEGRSIDIMKSLPIPENRLLMGKLLLHIAITSPMALISSLVLSAVFDMGALIPSLIIPQLYIVVSAALGLVFNLRFVNLTWTSETVAVKQGVSVLFSILANLILCIITVGLCFVSWLVSILILAVTAIVLVRYLQKGGSKRFLAL